MTLASNRNEAKPLERRNHNVARGIRRPPAVFLWGPVAAWASLILVLTSTPQDNMPVIPIPHLDLLVHIGLYGILGVFLQRALVWGTRFGPRSKAWLITYVCGQLFGILDEIHQTIPILNRSCDPLDAVADGIGVLLGALFYTWYVTRFRSARRETVD